MVLRIFTIYCMCHSDVFDAFEMYLTLLNSDEYRVIFPEWCYRVFFLLLFP